MPQRLVLVVLVIGAAGALWLLRQAGVDVPGRTWAILFGALGVWSLLSGLLLKLQVARPSAFWGRTSLGAALMGVGLLLLAVGGTWAAPGPEPCPKC